MVYFMFISPPCIESLKVVGVKVTPNLRLHGTWLCGGVYPLREYADQHTPGHGNTNYSTFDNNWFIDIVIM